MGTEADETIFSVPAAKVDRLNIVTHKNMRALGPFADCQAPAICTGLPTTPLVILRSRMNGALHPRLHIPSYGMKEVDLT